MKHGIFVLLYCLGCLSGKTQTDSAFAFASYSFSHIDDTTQRHFPRTGDMRLYLGRQMSAYLDHGQLIAMLRMINAPQANADMIADLKKNMTRTGIFKQYAANQLSYVAPAGLNTYLIEEPIPDIKWEIQQETKNSKGYACQKATGYFRGRNWEAWFCAQLPYSNGPWKLGGLPGLILEAYDTDRDVVFGFVSFETGSDVPSYSIPVGLEKTTAKAYQRYIDAMNKDTKAMLGASTASGGKVFMGMSASNAGGPPKRMKILNNPLEKNHP